MRLDGDVVLNSATSSSRTVLHCVVGPTAARHGGTFRPVYSVIGSGHAWKAPHDPPLLPHRFSGTISAPSLPTGGLDHVHMHAHHFEAVISGKFLSFRILA